MRARRPVRATARFLELTSTLGRASTAVDNGVPDRSRQDDTAAGCDDRDPQGDRLAA